MHLVLSQAGVWQLLLLHVSIRFSAAIRSSVASFAAVLVLLPLDLFRLSTTGLHFRDLLYASEIHVVAILLALPLLQASYFLLRVLAAFSSRLPGAGGFLAGVSLFSDDSAGGGRRFAAVAARAALEHRIAGLPDRWAL
jgi:hypothetical protein